MENVLLLHQVTVHPGRPWEDNSRGKNKGAEDGWCTFVRTDSALSESSPLPPPPQLYVPMSRRER